MEFPLIDSNYFFFFHLFSTLHRILTETNLKRVGFLLRVINYQTYPRCEKKRFVKFHNLHVPLVNTWTSTSIMFKSLVVIETCNSIRVRIVTVCATGVRGIEIEATISSNSLR